MSVATKEKKTSEHGCEISEGIRPSIDRGFSIAAIGLEVQERRVRDAGRTLSTSGDSKVIWLRRIILRIVRRRDSGTVRS